MRFDVITLFPELFTPFTSSGINRRAFETGAVELNLWQLRDYAEGAYRRVDDRPFGGGPGMVMLAEPLEQCLSAIRQDRSLQTPEKPQVPVVLFSPIGQKLNQRQASFGSKLLMWAGLSFTVTLATRTFGVALIGDMHDIYAPSWDQGVMVAGQFTAITLSNIAFLRIFLEIAERQKLAMTHELAVTNERAESIRRTSVELQKLLQEREETIRQLAIFNKTAGMGALVASLAHELNQPLTAMQLNAELIDSAFLSSQTSANSDHAIKEAMSDLLKDNQRAATIIKTLRNMFGNGRKSVTTFDMNELVNEVLLICKSRLTHQNIALKVELHPDAVRITADKSQLQQVFLNLITNAADAFSANFAEQKCITVRTQLDDTQACLTVTDNGSGIAPEIVESIFELLRTNKDEGMGVGLWLSRTIVESHHGTINFETGSETGTTFTVTLPFSQETLIY